jgi:LSD1 subclass zinc finger protein
MSRILIPRYPLVNGRPAVICSGCVEAIPAPRGETGRIKCPYCDKVMQVVNIQPAGENSRAT